MVVIIKVIRMAKCTRLGTYFLAMVLTESSGIPLIGHQRQVHSRFKDGLASVRSVQLLIL